MRLGLVLAGFAGLFLATILIGWYGWSDVAGAVSAAGWRGIAALCIVQIFSIALCAVGWRTLLPGGREQPLSLWCYARWLREAVGNLLGILPVAGEIVGARLLAISGLSRSAATSTVVADFATESLSQAVFTVLGLVLFILDRTNSSPEWLWLGLGAAIPAASVLFIARSRRALVLVGATAQTLARSPKLNLTGSNQSLCDAVHALFRRRAAIARSVAFHFVCWVLGAAQIWLALRFMGRPIDWDDALILESLVCAIRGAVFIVPSGIGVQEGGYVVIGALFGLSPEVALALSLVKRARDLVLGVPALVAWQALEGGRLRRAAALARMHHNS
jgi:putative membrane protein